MDILLKALRTESSPSMSSATRGRQNPSSHISILVQQMDGLRLVNPRGRGGQEAERQAK
jgi:hypothetical protein